MSPLESIAHVAAAADRAVHASLESGEAAGREGDFNSRLRK
jgi:hypothetical protein